MMGLVTYKRVRGCTWVLSQEQYKRHLSFFLSFFFPEQVISCILGLFFSCSRLRRWEVHAIQATTRSFQVVARERSREPLRNMGYCMHHNGAEDRRATNLWLWCVSQGLPGIWTVPSTRLLVFKDIYTSRACLWRFQAGAFCAVCHLAVFCLFLICLSVCLSACLSVCLSACLSVCLSVCQNGGWRKNFAVFALSSFIYSHILFLNKLVEASMWERAEECIDDYLECSGVKADYRLLLRLKGKVVKKAGRARSYRENQEDDYYICEQPIGILYTWALIWFCVLSFLRALAGGWHYIHARHTTMLQQVRRNTSTSCSCLILQTGREKDLTSAAMKSGVFHALSFCRFVSVIKFMYACTQYTWIYTHKTPMCICFLVDPHTLSSWVCMSPMILCVCLHTNLYSADGGAGNPLACSKGALLERDATAEKQIPDFLGHGDASQTTTTFYSASRRGAATCCLHRCYDDYWSLVVDGDWLC